MPTTTWTKAERGSSPLTRGKLTASRSASRSCGLIPAHAGKTPQRGLRPQRGGSSPLTRGKHYHSSLFIRVAGLIPAHAGKTAFCAAISARCAAHPRSRGENGANDFLRTIVQGSSPLTRGKPNCAPRPTVAPGLIPAHAGKTRHRRSCRQSCRAHPRSRGENSTSWSTPSGDMGSSPLTRGKRSGDRRGP